MRCAIYTRVSTDEQAMSEYSSLKRQQRKTDVDNPETIEAEVC